MSKICSWLNQCLRTETVVCNWSMFCRLFFSKNNSNKKHFKKVSHSKITHGRCRLLYYYEHMNICFGMFNFPAADAHVHVLVLWHYNGANRKLSSDHLAMIEVIIWFTEATWNLYSFGLMLSEFTHVIKRSTSLFFLSFLTLRFIPFCSAFHALIGKRHSITASPFPLCLAFRKSRNNAAIRKWLEPN